MLVHCLVKVVKELGRLMPQVWKKNTRYTVVNEPIERKLASAWSCLGTVECVFVLFRRWIS